MTAKKMEFILKHVQNPDIREIVLLRTPINVLKCEVVQKLFTLDAMRTILDFTLMSSSEQKYRNFARLASLALTNYNEEALTLLEPVLIKFI